MAAADAAGYGLYICVQLKHSMLMTPV
jgi:hypothetical protein